MAIWFILCIPKVYRYSATTMPSMPGEYIVAFRFASSRDTCWDVPFLHKALTKGFLGSHKTQKTKQTTSKCLSCFCVSIRLIRFPMLEMSRAHRHEGDRPCSILSLLGKLCIGKAKGRLADFCNKIKIKRVCELAKEGREKTIIR